MMMTHPDISVMLCTTDPFVEWVPSPSVFLQRTVTRPTMCWIES